ncbi:MAG: hydantoinase B/oxoprolinase family protein [Armatimonadia bacterium]|nr:hydantoinase B/oxoprolinase family protein [Armatimonadia bacterium]
MGQPDRDPHGLVDPAEVAFYGNLFISIAEEMGVSLGRTAYSPNIKERRDFSCGLFDGDGQLIAQAMHIPVHLGAMPRSVDAALGAFADLGPGDVVMLNDPFAGGTHLPDITLVSRVFVPGEDTPIAALASRAHHADVGGMSPGSMPSAREIVQEGFRIPPVRLRRSGRVDEDILSLLLANTRTPEERGGDLRAQLAAHETGARRVVEAAERYGADELDRRMGDIVAHGERLMRAVIQRIPDGRYEFEDCLDGDGVSDGPVTVRCAVDIEGDGAVVDFAGTDSERPGGINAVAAVTLSAVYYCFACLLMTPAEEETPPDVPINGGCFQPIEVRMPERSVVSAGPPRSVAGGNVETSQRIVDVVLGALSQALPGVVPAASQGTMNNVSIGGWDHRHDRPFTYYETLGGGMGARPDRPGLDAVQVHMTNTLNTPVEAMEFAYPLRVRRYEIIDGSGGPGLHRGGCGLRRELETLGSCQVALLTERRKTRPYGLAGGGPGAPGRNRVITDGAERDVAAKCSVELGPGDGLIVETPGGGGHGTPTASKEARDPCRGSDSTDD